jgi:hypothetical protein
VMYIVFSNKIIGGEVFPLFLEFLWEITSMFGNYVK